MNRIHFALLIAIFLPFGAFCINPMVRNYNRKVSNAGTQNWHIIQDNKNWMYFANNKGLLEFDGNRWTIYPIRNYTNVRSLCYDKPTERIYAGAYDEFGYWAPNQSGLLEYNSLIDKLKPEEKNFNEIWNILKIENTVYFQADKVVFQYKARKLTQFTFQNKIDCSAAIQNTLIISNKEDGTFFLNGNMFLKFPNAEILKNKKICAILPFQKNKILFITDFNGIFLYNGENVIQYKTDIDSFLAENQVFCATIENSRLALGTVRNGLVVKDLNTNSTIYSNTSSGLQNNTILSMAFDREHNLWLGLDKGIDYVQINSPIYDLFGNSQLFGAGYYSLILGATLYLGTNQGLYMTSFPVPNSPIPTGVKLIPRMQGQVWSLSLIDNTLFCGSDHGAFIIKGTKAEQIEGVNGTWGFRALKGRPDCILGSSYQGFFILKKINGKWLFSNFIKGFQETGGMFEQDKDSSIWFSHWIKGVSRLTLNKDLTAFSKIETYDTSKGFPSTRDNTLCPLNNNLYFSTQNGFYQFNAASNSVERTSWLNNLFKNQNHTMRLHQSPKGDIWATSYYFIGGAFLQKNGQYKIDSLSFSILKNKLINGFEQLNFVDDKNIIVSTEDGFSWIDVSKIIHEKSHFKVYIRNVYLTNQNDSAVLGYINSKVGTQIPEFKHNNNSLRFEYVASEYRNENGVSYSYKLENLDTKWSSYSSANTKEYTKLRKGTYQFKVRAKSLLEPNPVETSFEFIILPAWYETKLAYGIYTLFLILIILGLVKFIKIKSEEGARKMEAKKKIEMEEQERKYEEEAKEKRKEIIELKNQRLHYELRHKSQDLASSTMNLIRKNEILLEISKNLNNVADEIKEKNDSNQLLKKISHMQDDIKHNIEHDNNWKRFAENFDLVYENYLKRLGEQFPQLTISDKKLCAYLKMDLSSKDIAPLLNMSYRSVEMSRYRLRKKMELDREVNLSDFLQNF
jgi:DNA-binding CsgD family transcriptional regulator